MRQLVLAFKGKGEGEELAEIGRRVVDRKRPQAERGALVKRITQSLVERRVWVRVVPLVNRPERALRLVVQQTKQNALCVQKIGNVFRVDRQALAELPGLGMLPLGQGVANELIPRAELEGYLQATLSAA